MGLGFVPARDCYTYVIVFTMELLVNFVSDLLHRPRPKSLKVEFLISNYALT